MSGATQLPSGWNKAWDASYNCYYYFNPSRGISQWEPPVADSTTTLSSASCQPTQLDAKQLDNARDPPSKRQRIDESQMAADSSGHNSGQQTYATTAVQLETANASMLNGEAGTAAHHHQLESAPSGAAANAAAHAGPSDAHAAAIPAVDGNASDDDYFPQLPPPAASTATTTATTTGTATATGTGFGASAPPSTAPQAAGSAAAGAGTADGSSAAAEAAPGSGWFYQQSDGSHAGPFSQEQLAGWRGLLPMDLLVTYRDDPASAPQQEEGAAGAAGAAGAGATEAVAEDAAPEGEAVASQLTAAGPASVAGAGASEECEAPGTELAELLGDHELLAHFRACCPGAPPGGAPPAAYWEAVIVQQQRQAATASAAAASRAQAAAYEAEVAAQYWGGSAAGQLPAAAAGSQPHHSTHPGYHHHHHHHEHPAAAAQQHEQQEQAGQAPLRGAAAYADAVLSALPAHDEAVQLAKLAASAGRSLQEVVEFSRGGAGSGAPPALAAAAAAAAGYTADYTTMGSWDPRTGRITAAASEGGEGGTASLYGDISSWCNPAELEAALQRHAAVRKHGLPTHVWKQLKERREAQKKAAQQAFLLS